MNILEVTTHVTIDEEPRFRRNRTGFGYMVYDIARTLAKTEKVDIFCATIMNNGISRDGLNIIKWNWIHFFKSFRLYNVKLGIDFLKRYPVPGFYPKMRIIYFSILVHYIEKIVQMYDVVHIHGCTPLTQFVVNVCVKMNVKYLVTLHGLNSIGKSINLCPALKCFEQNFLKRASQNDFPVSFISTGDYIQALKIICSCVPPKYWYVVPNGCNISKISNNFNVRLKYSILNTDFLFVFVGNISKNKNQIDVAKAFLYLKNKGVDKIKVLFVGKEADQGELSFYIKQNHLENDLIMTGFVSKQDIHNYYSSADATILTSLQEGFGLSIIEGFVYGKPNLTYSDLSAVSDIYNKDVMMLVKERKTESLANAMLEMSYNKWDEKLIKKYSNKFSLQAMSDHYLSILKLL